MNSYQNPKVLGAFLVGFAIVAGTYVYATFGKPRLTAPQQAATVAEAAPTRVFIPVTDDNDDGLEDWRDQFITAPALNINASGTAYVAPTTLTGQLGVNLMEDLIKVKAGGPVARTTEQVVVDAVENLETSAHDTIYDVKDIIIAPNTSKEAVRAYGNALADIILTYNVPGLDNELILLRDHISSPQTVDNSDLKKLAEMYKNYRDNTLLTPVPKDFVKVHLDLINVYSALYANIDAMSKAGTDPVVALVRLKRYEDDAKGLTMALNQVYNAVIPYASVFGPDDPAIVFVNFYKESP